MFIKNKSVSLFLLLSLLMGLSSFSVLNACNYEEKIEQCINNQKSHRAIDNFVCIQGSRERITYQIVLDDKFKQVDEKIEKFLDDLTQSKDYYFGETKKEDFIAGIDLIEQRLGDYGEYSAEYKELCSSSTGSILQESMSCLGDETAILNAKDFLQQSECEDLYKTKINIYRKVAYDTLKENKAQILKDSHKLFTQRQRGKYGALLDLIAINIGYIERLWKKWPSKTYNAY